MSTAIREEVLVHFFKSYLQLVCRGSARSIVNNPALDFTKKAKSGGFDHLDDDDYTQLLAETEELSSLWHKTSSQPAFAVLVEALTRMNPDGEQLETCARILASAYASSEQFAAASNAADMPSLLSLAPSQDFEMDGPEGAEAPRLREHTDILKSPSAIFEYLKKSIYGQDDACSAAAVFLWNHVNGRRRNMVFAGPTSCGKTEIWRALSKIYPAICIVDSPNMVPEGYKGSFYPRSIWDSIHPRLRSRAIIVLDEFDKLLEHTGGSVNFSSLLQTEFLRMMDGDTIRYGKGDGASQPPMKVSCAHVSFVMCGSFETMLKARQEAANAPSAIGFASGKAGGARASSPAVEYTSDDLITYAGMRREIAGRVSRIIQLYPLTEPELLHLGVCICNALDKCERMQIVHRDVKPDNIFVTQTGDFKLGDFGIAHHFEPEKPETADAGTLLYMAPEVYRGEGADGRADLYSLGIVLYRLSNGNFEPYMDRSTRVITRKLRGEAFMKRMENPAPLPAPCDASPKFAQIILKACSFNPDNRYPSAAAMRRDLTALLAANERKTAAPGVLPGVRLPGARPFTPRLAAIAGAAALAGIAGIWALAHKPASSSGDAATAVQTEAQTEKQTEKPTERQTEQQTDGTPGSSPDILPADEDRSSVPATEETPAAGTAVNDFFWDVYNYTDFLGEPNGTYYTRASVNFQGSAQKPDGSTDTLFLDMLLDSGGFWFRLVRPDYSTIVNDGTETFTMNAHLITSTGKELWFPATVAPGTDWGAFNTAGTLLSDDLYQYPEGETQLVFLNPTYDYEQVSFSIPHHSTYRTAYDYMFGVVR